MLRESPPTATYLDLFLDAHVQVAKRADVARQARPANIAKRLERIGCRRTEGGNLERGDDVRNGLKDVIWMAVEP